MTRKDAIDRLDIIVSKHEVDDVYITLTNEKDYKALKVAINSLRIDEQYELEYEQAEPRSDVLDKIRAEIDSLHNGCGLFNDGIDKAIDIIDKYMAESEDEK